MFVHLLRQKKINLRSGIVFGILFDVLLSIMMFTVAKLPTYYSYMIVIPIAVALCSGLALCEPGKLRNAVLILCSLSAAAGAGLHAAAYIGNYQDRNYSHLEHFVEQTVHADDIAYVRALHDGDIYLAVKGSEHGMPICPKQKAAVALVIPLMSQQQKDSITVLLIPSSELEYTTSGLGGHWQETGQMIAPSGRNLFGNRRVGLVTFRPIDLAVYRRR